MTGLWNLQRAKSFSLLETLISLIILSIVISGFSQVLTSNISYQTYKDLQICENDFYLTGQIINSDKIKFVQY
ncbi:MAG: prepilin-type N-terminal cleavage/methylation domain-containing protein [Arcobacteraceae bacterium]|nr:prepilin-type N-terminal cleavage/methylation domain-containing protein [Arcobacteraceae bacterium]